MKRLTISRQSKLRLLIYGRPGSGKTTLAGTAGLDDRAAPVLWLDAGGNPISLGRLREPKITVLQIDKLSELADVYNWLRNGQKPNDAFAKLNSLTPPYKTIVFDGITHLQRLSFDAVMGTGDLAPGLMPPRPEWPHYRSVLGQMIIIASKYYTLDMHVIVTALEHTEQRFLIPGDSKTQYMYREPLLAGQSIDEFPGWALNVGRLALASTYEPRILKSAQAENATSLLQFQPTRYIDAKDQLGLGAYIPDPTIRQFLDIIDAR